MQQLDYSGTTPTGTSDYTLFDSTDLSVGVIGSIPGCRYRLSVKHSHAGTLKGYAKSLRAGSWVQFYQKALKAPAAAIRMHELSIPIVTHRDVKFVWTNGGTAQDPWYVGHSLVSAQEDDSDRLRQIAATVPGPAASATSEFAAAASTTHAVYVVHASWLGQRMRFTANGAKIWVVFGTSSGVEADRAAVVTGTPPAWTGSVKICPPIPDGQYADWYIDPSWTHFSFEGDAAGTLTATISDYEQTDFPD
jgi:hypothetical protein